MHPTPVLYAMDTPQSVTLGTQNATSFSKYIGTPLRTLPTPCAILDLPTVRANSTRLLTTISTLPLSLRAHIKTHKTLEVTRLQLGTSGQHTAVLVSTIAEAFSLGPLIKDGTVTDILYGLPLSRTAIPQLTRLRALYPGLTVTLLLDHPGQLSHLPADLAWPAFIKLDCGSLRAGLPPTSAALPRLIAAVQQNPATTLHGFYAHAGHSYASTSDAEVVSHLLTELNACIDAASLLPGVPLTLSFGATPTAMATEGARRDLERVKAAHPEWTLEVHAGCYAILDLQQVAASEDVHERDIALTIAGEVVSVYEERGEALVNAGCLALGREPCREGGWGKVVGKGWRVGRISQEHGVLVKEEGAEELQVGEVVRVLPNHACIAAAGHEVFFVTEDGETVKEVWRSSSGWNVL